MQYTTGQLICLGIDSVFLDSDSVETPTTECISRPERELANECSFVAVPHELFVYMLVKTRLVFTKWCLKHETDQASSLILFLLIPLVTPTLLELILCQRGNE